VTDHFHVWAKSGCYCGAQRCEAFGYSDGKYIAVGAGLLPTGSGRHYFCDQPATNGDYCEFHSIAERYFRSTGAVSIAAINEEIQTGEPAIAYPRHEFEEGR
jgi:hypothetical protein